MDYAQEEMGAGEFNDQDILIKIKLKLPDSKMHMRRTVVGQRHIFRSDDLFLTQTICQINKIGQFYEIVTQQCLQFLFFFYLKFGFCPVISEKASLGDECINALFSLFGCSSNNVSKEIVSKDERKVVVLSLTVSLCLFICDKRE